MPYKRIRNLLSLASVWLLTSSSLASQVTVISTTSHNKHYFTQGLIISNGQVVETTGLYGHSVLASYALGEKPTEKLKLANHYFGEGVTQLGDSYYWLSWRAGTAFKVSTKDFSLSETYSYEGEGWGITHNGLHLIMSNGSNILQFKDPSNFKTVATIKVQHRGKPVNRLNELEWVNGYILANIWREDRIIKIDSRNGEVVNNYDLSELRSHFLYPKTDVLNGIAYDQVSGKLYVTGKYWPKLFEVRLAD